MFFEKNKKLLIGTAAIALLWIVLFYTLVAPKWAEAEANKTAASEHRKDWELYMRNDAAKKAAEKAPDASPIEYLTQHEAEKKLKENRSKIEIKFSELKKIEFGDHETLKPFSVAAVGKNGDPQNLLNEKTKQAALRANGILKAPISPEIVSGEFENAAINLLRVAIFEAFMTACRDAKVEQIVQVRHFAPAPILVPEEEKTDEEKPEEPKKKSKYKDDKDKDEEKVAKVDRLIQFPMKVQLRVPERFSNQVLFELEKATPEKRGDEMRGYFCIRGFHVAVRENVPNLVEMTVQVSALLRESEVRALRIALKDPRSGPSSKRSDDDLGY